MLALFRCVGRAVVAKGFAGLVSDFVPGGQWVLDVAGMAWKDWRQERQQEQLRDDVEQLAAATLNEARAAAKEVAREVAAGDPKLGLDLELYLTQLPITVRQSLARADDPTGTTVPADFRIHDEDDVARLLPARLPRFRPGDAPSFLRGWVLEEMVGAGGFGEVWKGRNRRYASLVSAFKFGHAVTDRELVLLHEGAVLDRVMAAGRHPGIVALEGAWEDGDEVPWLRFEFVAGGDLTRLIHEWQRLPPAERLNRAVAALRGLAETVGHFHRLNPAIVHRDLKPSNILVDAATGRLKISDFGIGAVSARRLLDGDTHGTANRVGRYSVVRGSYTLLYASPQQRAGSKLLDPRDDVHALGVIAYQMLTGRLDLGAGPDFADDLRDHGAPEALVALLGRCVAQKAERRPKDALELAAALAALGGPVEEPPSEPAEEATRTAKPTPVAPATKPVTLTKRANVTIPSLAPGLSRSYGGAVALHTLAGHTEGLLGVGLSPDGRVVATTSTDKIAKLWDSDSGRELRVLSGHNNYVFGVSFSPDGRVVATAGRDNTAKLWDAATGRELRTLAGHSDWIRSVSFSPDGRVVATASDDRMVKLWDSASGREMRVLNGFKDYVYGVSFSPDGRVVATAGRDNTARLWDATTGGELRTLAGHTTSVNGVSFSPDGRVVATASGDSTARLWDAATGRELRTLTGHTASVNGVSFSPDGRVVATASGDSTARLWDAATGRELRTLAGHTASVNGVSFSPDGRMLVTASNDKTAKLWLLLRDGETADWTAGAVTQPPKPVVTVVRSGDGVVYPGDHVWAHVAVENGGRGDLVQVRSDVRSDHPVLSRWQATLGRIKPGEKVERCHAAVLPLDTPAGELRGELVFGEGNDFPIFPRPLAFTVRPLPRPDFAVRWAVVNDGSGLSQGNGDGRPKRGEYVDVAVSIHNQTGESFDALFVSCAAKELPAGTRVTAPRGEFGAVADGATAEGRVSFAVDPGGQPGPATFELRVESADGRTFAVETVQLTVG